MSLLTQSLLVSIRLNKAGKLRSQQPVRCSISTPHGAKKSICAYKRSLLHCQSGHTHGMRDGKERKPPVCIGKLKQIVSLIETNSEQNYKVTSCLNNLDTFVFTSTLSFIQLCFILPQIRDQRSLNRQSCSLTAWCLSENHCAVYRYPVEHTQWSVTINTPQAKSFDKPTH